MRVSGLALVAPLVACVVTACSTAPEEPMPPPAAKSSSSSSPGVGAFGPGIVVAQSGAALLAAIAAPELAGRRLRVPVQVDVVTHMVRQVRPGFAADAPTLPVDDSHLGIGLADRSRQRCGERSPCALWLVGHWEDTPPGGPRFVVHEVGDVIAPDATAGITHILVEQRAP